MAEHINTKVVHLIILANYIVFQVTSLSKMWCNGYLILWSVVLQVKLKNFMITGRFSFILTQHKDTSTIAIGPSTT